jgi:hypothetical protein
MAKNKPIRELVLAPVELIKDFGEAIVSISKQESDEKIAALKAGHPVKRKTKK